MNPIRVLIIEDDEDIIDLIKSVLEPSFECLTASNGLDGLQQSYRGDPDLIICDIMMPVMDGREFVKRLHKVPELDQTPVIFLSALTSRDHIRDGYELGAALYITKPIDPARFKRNLELFVSDHGVVPKHKRLRIDQIQSMSIGTSETPPPTQPEEKKPSAPSPQAAPAPGKKRPIFDWRVVGINPQDAKKNKPQRPRLLIVEDDGDTIQLIRTGLEENYELIEARDGVSAIEQAVRYKPDLFIIDGMLPKMTGYQLTMMLKKNREFYRSPIIFISGKATERDQQYVKGLGVPHFLAKPFTGARILAMVREITGQPDFAIHTQRVDLNQVYLEKFQHIETHRSSGTPTSLEQLERRKVEHEIKKQIF